MQVCIHLYRPNVCALSVVFLHHMLMVLPCVPPPCRPTIARAGNCGISVDLPTPTSAASAELSSFAALFAEELGLVLEVAGDKAALVSSLFNQAGVPCSIIGKVSAGACASMRCFAACCLALCWRSALLSVQC